MKQICLTVFFLLGALVVFAQDSFSVKGKVHMESGEPVSNVSIHVVGTNLVAISDANGRYSFSSVPKGRQVLKVSSLEIMPMQLTVDVYKDYPDLHIHIDPKGNMALDEVRVERKSAKKEIETSGFAVAVVETKEAALRNLTTNELLDRTVGVRVRQNGGIGSQIDYNLNGMSGSTVGVFIDGIPISTFGSSFNLNTIPPSMIERIEVYKGVLPSHLSGDYVGGAINVIMRKDATNSVNAAVSYGSFNTFQGDLGAFYRNPKSGFISRLSGFYTDTDNSFELWGKFAVITTEDFKLKRYQRFKHFNNRYRSAGGRFEFGFSDVKWADHFLVGYTLTDVYKDIPHGITTAQPYVGRFQEYDAHVFTLNYNKQNLLLDGLGLGVTAAYSKRGTYLQDTARAMYNWDGNPLMYIQNGVLRPRIKREGQGQQGDAVITNVDRNIVSARTNLSYAVANGHKVSLNHNVNITHRKDEDLLNLKNLTNTISKFNTAVNILGLNYEAQTFNKRLQTSLMFKYTFYKNQYLNLDGNKTTHNSSPGYNIAVSYNIKSNLYLLGSAENSHIVPTDDQIFGNPEQNILENKDLTPERNLNYNIGFRYAPLKMDEHMFSIYASAFFRKGFDKISTQLVDSVIVGRESDANIETTKFINLDRTESLGFEAELLYTYKNKLNALINLSKFNSVFKQKTDEYGNPNHLYGLQLPNEPFFTINGSVQYRFENFIQKKSVFNVYYNTGYVAPFSTVWVDSDNWFETPTQFFHDIGGSYRVPKENIIISVDVKNFMNAQVYDNFGVQKPGRGVFVKLNYIFSKK